MPHHWGSRLSAAAIAAALILGASNAVVARELDGARSLTDWPRIDSPHARDATIEQRIAQIVSGLTLEQKIGQMTQAEIRSVTPDQVRRYYLGAILNGGGAWPDMNPHASVREWAAMSEKFQRAALSTDLSVKIPILWGTDAVHGHGNVYGATLYPHNMGLGAAHDPALERDIARQTALAARATGINWIFAPTVAVLQSPRWGRSYESFGSDPQVVRSYAAAAVEGMQGDLRGNDFVIASVKHFMGDGGTWRGVDQGVNQSTLRDMMNTHAQGYYGALGAGVQTVMASYNSWNDVAAGHDYGKMHGSRELLTGVLKERLGFDGFIVSDWNAIEQVPGCERARCVQAINAGIDMFMVPDDWIAFIANTVADVRANKIPMSRIDDAVTRILRVKMRMGLFERGVETVDSRVRDGVVDSPESRALARRAVRESLVLLKNQRGVLPLARKGRVLVVGAGATDVRRQVGGWSSTWQGSDSRPEDFPQAVSLLEAIRRAIGKEAVDFSEQGTGVDVSRYVAVVMVASENAYAEMKGDIVYPASLQHSARYPADLEALRAVSGKGVPVVTVLLSGRPVYANDLLNLSDAFVAAWLPGTEGEGVSDVLFRDAKGAVANDFRGRLPLDWPTSACPEREPSTSEFRRGRGLGYSRPGRLAQLPVVAATAGCAVP